MKVVWFDCYNYIDVSNSDELTSSEEDKLNNWLDEECNHNDWVLHHLEIDGKTWTMYFFDNSAGFDNSMEI